MSLFFVSSSSAKLVKTAEVLFKLVEVLARPDDVRAHVEG